MPDKSTRSSSPSETSILLERDTSAGSSPKKKKLRQRIAGVAKAAATLGPVWAVTRARLVMVNRLGLVERKTPLQSWDQLPLRAVLLGSIPDQHETYGKWRAGHSPRFFFDAGTTIFRHSALAEKSIEVADRILAGEFPFFGYSRNLGFPPRWRRNPATCSDTPRPHWSKIDEFGSGDVKLCWEANRFSWAFALSRAYARSGDERYAEAFWQLFEDWVEKNQPNSGINWKCGQEVSFRAMAMCFSFYAFAHSAASTSERVARLVTVIAIHARRIEAYIEYALSQKNNHGISEGTGLWTIGLLFPELAGSRHWRARGKRVIESEVRRQIYADGSYVQHSANYHRLMLHDLGWSLRLGELNGDPLAPDVLQALCKATHFLHALTDATTGWTPNYGANDGALLLPLSDCDYPDMRPVLQSSHFIAEREALFPPGPWDEEMVWLNGAASLKASRLRSVPPADLNAAEGGCYTIHSGDSWAMLRASKYVDRPSQADQLHLDLWWRGINILCDPGTYSYNGEAPFDDGFASTRYHNTVAVDGTDQMTRVGRFLWADWADVKVRRFDSCRGFRVLEAEHDGYGRRGIIHRRIVTCISPSAWIVVDDLVGRGHHQLRLHWLMPDMPARFIDENTVELHASVGVLRVHTFSSSTSSFSVTRAGQKIAGGLLPEQETTCGWSSRYYARKEPALSLVRECCCSLPIRFISVITPGELSPVTVSSSFDAVEIDSKRISISAIGRSLIFKCEEECPTPY